MFFHLFVSGTFDSLLFYGHKTKVTQEKNEHLHNLKAKIKSKEIMK